MNPIRLGESALAKKSSKATVPVTLAALPGGPRPAPVAPMEAWDPVPWSHPLESPTPSLVRAALRAISSYSLYCDMLSLSLSLESSWVLFVVSNSNHPGVDRL